MTEPETSHSDDRDAFEQGIGCTEDGDMTMNAPHDNHVVEDVIHVSKQK